MMLTEYHCHMLARLPTHSGVERGGTPSLAEGSRVGVGSAVRHPNDDIRGVAQLVNANQVQSVCLPRTNHHLSRRGTTRTFLAFADVFQIYLAVVYLQAHAL